MALWKPFRGSRTALDSQELHDGYVYFCVDDGSLHFDYTDADGALQRKQINAKDAETLMGMSLDELKNAINVALENGEGENSLVQTSSELNNAYSEGTTALGMGNIAGSKAYRIVAVSQEPTAEYPTYTELPEGTYTLEEIDDNLQVGLSYTYRLEHSGYNIGTITDIDRDNKIVTVAPYIVEKMRSAGNYMSIVGHPEFGIIDVGYAAYAEGYQTMACESGSHSEGYATEALGRYSHVEGRDTKAWYGSHAEGSGSKAMGECSHAEGHFSNAKGFYSHSEGMADENQQDNYGAFGKGSHNEGRHTLAAADFSHAEGQGSTVVSQAQDGHAEGFSTTVNSAHGHAEGMLTISGGLAAHSEGRETEALGIYGHTEGYKSKVAVEAQDGHAEGYNTQVLKAHGHAEGESAIASGQAAHAEGQNGEASGTAAHKEGQAKKASGTAAHAEGIDTQATAGGAHAEGAWSQATAIYAHAEGKSTKATGKHAHSENANTEARAENSHAEGLYTIAGGMNQHVQGKFNVIDSANQYAHIVGGGDETTRKNIHTLDWDGNAWFAGKVSATEVNAPNIDAKLADKMSVAPVDGVNLIDENNKINTHYISDTILGQLKFGGTITSIRRSGETIVSWDLSPSSLLTTRIQELHPEHDGYWSDLYFRFDASDPEQSIVLAFWEFKDGNAYTSPVITDMRYLEGFYFILEVDTPDDVQDVSVPQFKVGDWWLFCDNKVQKIDNTDTITHIANADTSLLQINGSSGLELKHLTKTNEGINLDQALLISTENSGWRTQIGNESIRIAETLEDGKANPDCYLSLSAWGLHHVYYGSDISITPGNIDCNGRITANELVANKITGTVDMAVADENGNNIAKTYIPKPAQINTIPVLTTTIDGAPVFSEISFDTDSLTSATKITTRDQEGKIAGRQNWGTVEDIDDNELVTSTMVHDLFQFEMSEGADQVVAWNSIKIGDTVLNEAQLKKILAFIESIEG